MYSREDRVMDRSDILNALKEIARSNDSVQYGVSETMDRLQDFHIQRVISKREHHAGVTKRIIDQHQIVQFFLINIIVFHFCM
jgi:ActR/RegA family two-component response regulator